MAKERFREERHSFTGGMCLDTLLSCQVGPSLHIPLYPAH